MAPQIGLVISTLLDGIYRVQQQLSFGWQQVVVVHQIPDTTLEKYADVHAQLRLQGVQVLIQEFRGLSKSRNAGLQAVTTDYALITDDDVVFPEDTWSQLQAGIQQSQGADIITFQIQTPEGQLFKAYSSQAGKHNLRSIARVSSVEMLIKKSWFDTSHVFFDHQFGLGATFATGEEFIFLYDAIEQGASVYCYPAVIGIHPKESSGKKLTPAQLENKGAMISRVYGNMAPVYRIAFAWKKRKEYAEHATFIKALAHLRQGSVNLHNHD